MALARVLRIALISGLIPLLFRISHNYSVSRGQPTVPGLSYALGVIAVLFTARAFATETSFGKDARVQKDLLWGTALGCGLTIVDRWLG